MEKLNVLISKFSKSIWITKLRNLLVYLLIVVMVTMVVSFNTKLTHNELLLMKHNQELTEYKDSLENYINNELSSLKDREFNIIRNSLSISSDTTYNYVNPISDIQNFVRVQNNSYNTYEMIIENKWDSIRNIPNGLPIFSEDLIRISDDYGYRKHPIHKTWIFHDGVDISALTGTDVRATSSGMIIAVDESETGYGNKVIIMHKYGYSTLYAHLDGFNVSMGDYVSKGDIIGYVGNTGSSTAPHLHYEIKQGNKTINPEIFMDNSIYLAYK